MIAIMASSTNKSAAFWRGYKAWVNNGKFCRTVKHGNTRYYGGFKPFDYMTDRQKADWLNGIAYAKQERIECAKMRATQYHRKCKNLKARRAHGVGLTLKSAVD